MARLPSISENLSPQDKLRIARGARPVPGPLPLEALISLAADPDKEIHTAAQDTLDRLPEHECLQRLAASEVEEAVIRYFLEPAHVRPTLLPILLGNPATPQDAVTALAAAAGPEIIPALLDNLDLLPTPALVALKDNATYLHWQAEPPPQVLVLEADLLELLIQERQAEQLRPPAPAEAEQEKEEEAAPGKAESTLSKIAKMTVAQRVKLALLGSREERAWLIRDGNKVVGRAVLGSPKLTETEVESFAAMKNLNEEILRHISMNRKFMKNYTVMRNLVNNPRLPLDVSLPLLNRLLPADLRAVAASREVPDTVRKMAHKLVKARQPQ